MSSGVLNSLIAVGVGFVLSQVAEWLKTFHTTRRERRDRWNAMQRETILEIQQLLSSIYRLHIELIELFRRTLSPEATEDQKRLFRECSSEYNIAVVRLMALRHLLDDQQLESLVSNVQSLLDKMVNMKAPEEQGRSTDALSRAVLAVFQRARAVLPSLY